MSNKNSKANASQNESEKEITNKRVKTNEREMKRPIYQRHRRISPHRVELTRTASAPLPNPQFGPMGGVISDPASIIQMQDPLGHRLVWYNRPQNVLVIKKKHYVTVLPPFVQLVEWLIKVKQMTVWVEASVLKEPILLKDKKFQSFKQQLVTFKDGNDDLTGRIDFIICLGGDGTLLYASMLFQQSVPPVMAFRLGSLGFLTPFLFNDFEKHVTNVLEANYALILRNRLRCVIYRRVSTCKPPTTAADADLPQERRFSPHFRYITDAKMHKRLCQDEESCPISPSCRGHSTYATKNVLVLNEVVANRGASPYLSNIDLFIDGKYITSVQGDGLIISTPTGSTAYAVSAGASMLHPSVSAIVVTPICPHSLSFRPIVVPAGVELELAISPESRSTSWISFDGHDRQELFHGDSLLVYTSIYPLPSICPHDQVTDWFGSLAECLNWNVRKKQKCLDNPSDFTDSDDAVGDFPQGMEQVQDN